MPGTAPADLLRLHRLIDGLICRSSMVVAETAGSRLLAALGFTSTWDNGVVIPRIGLYYPYTHFRSSRWLKLAAMYWPGMARIVPQDFMIWDDDVTRTLSEKLGFITDVSPESARKVTAERAFQALHDFSADLQRRYAVPTDLRPDMATSGGYTPKRQLYRQFVTRHDSASSSHIRWPGPYLAGVSQDTFTRLIGIHHDNMSRRLRSLLLETGLADETADRRWLGVHPNIAWAYMCMLAEDLAEQNHLLPVTDQVAAYSGHGDWTAERFAAILLDDAPSHASPPAPDMAPAMGMLALRLVVPADLDGVPVEKIVKLRRRYADEFDAFQELISTATGELARELSTIADPVVLEAYLTQEVSRRFEQPLAQLRKAMRGVGVDTVVNATTTKFELPTAAVALTGSWAAGQPMVATAGAALGVMAVQRNLRRQRRSELAGSPAAYLWRAERTVTPKALITRILRR